MSTAVLALLALAAVAYQLHRNHRSAPRIGEDPADRDAERVRAELAHLAQLDRSYGSLGAVPAGHRAAYRTIAA